VTGDEKVVVSGVGVVTAFGAGVGPLLEGLGDGRCCFAPTRRVVTAGGLSPIVAEAPAGTISGRSRKAELLSLALGEALAATARLGEAARTVVFLVGQAPRLVGPPQTATDVADLVGPSEHEFESLFGARAVYLSHACASAAIGVCLAREWLRAGLADFAIVAGACALNRYEYASMEAVLALSASGARPFDEARNGTTIGEGAGAIVLEREASVLARFAEPLAYVAGAACRVGAGTANSAPELVRACIEGALADANIVQPDYIHAHAPGTWQGDAVELEVLEETGAARQWRSVPVSSHKGAVGHLLHASAFPALVVGLRSLRDGRMPGTVGLRDPPMTRYCRLLSERDETASIETVLVNSFGFGGNNASIVLAR
jgi:3-oxoacyl-[acyl-carrier-protein] synthase II